MKKSKLGDEYKNDIKDENGLIDYKKPDKLISLKERDIV